MATSGASSANWAWGDAAAAATNLAGGIAGAIASARQARKQRSFQERMFKNRYQYTMADMRSAGLNPILAYKQGGGSAPSGAMAQIPNVATSATSAAMQNRMERKQLVLMDQTLEKEGALADQATAATADLTSAAKLKEYQAATQESQRDLIRTQDRIARLSVPRLEIERDWYESGIGRKALQAELGSRAVGAVGDAAGSAISGIFPIGRMLSRRRPGTTRYQKPRVDINKRMRIPVWQDQSLRSQMENTPRYNPFKKVIRKSR